MQWYTGNTLYDTLLLIALPMQSWSWYRASSFAAYGGRFGGVSGQRVSSSARKQDGSYQTPGATGFPHSLLHGSQLGPDRTPLLPSRLDVPLHQPRACHSHADAGAAWINRQLLLGVVIAGWIVLLHGYFNAAYLTEFGTQYTTEWFSDPRFQIGLAIYIFGFTPNVHSDSICAICDRLIPVPTNRVTRFPTAVASNG